MKDNQNHVPFFIVLVMFGVMSFVCGSYVVMWKEHEHPKLPAVTDDVKLEIIGTRTVIDPKYWELIDTDPEAAKKLAKDEDRPMGLEVTLLGKRLHQFFESNSMGVILRYKIRITDGLPFSCAYKVDRNEEAGTLAVYNRITSKVTFKSLNPDWVVTNNIQQMHGYVLDENDDVKYATYEYFSVYAGSNKDAGSRQISFMPEFDSDFDGNDPKPGDELPKVGDFTNVLELDIYMMPRQAYERYHRR